MTGTCSVAECDRPAAPGRGGWCSTHYARNWRTGSPTGAVPRRRRDLTGQRFGRLVAAEPVAGGGRWLCRCDCGRTRTARAADLLRGLVRECSTLGVAHGREG